MPAGHGLAIELGQQVRRGLKVPQVLGIGQRARLRLRLAGEIREDAALVRRRDHDQRRDIPAVRDGGAAAVASDALDVGARREAAEAVPDEDDARRAGEALDGVDDDLQLARFSHRGDVGHGEQLEAVVEIGEVDAKRLRRCRNLTAQARLADGALVDPRRVSAVPACRQLRERVGPRVGRRAEAVDKNHRQLAAAAGVPTAAAPANRRANGGNRAALVRNRARCPRRGRAGFVSR